MFSESDDPEVLKFQIIPFFNIFCLFIYIFAYHWPAFPANDQIINNTKYLVNLSIGVFAARFVY